MSRGLLVGAALVASLPAIVVAASSGRRPARVLELNGLRVALEGGLDRRLAGALSRPGDAPLGPGADLTRLLPRPPGARRLLAAVEPGRPYAIAVFQDDQTPPAESARRHRSRLQAAGVEVRERGHAMWLRRGDLWALVVAGPARGGRGTVTTVATVRGTTPASSPPRESP